MYASYVINRFHEIPYHELTRIYSETYKLDSYIYRNEDCQRLRRLIRDHAGEDSLLDAMDGTLADDTDPKIVANLAYELLAGGGSRRVLPKKTYSYHCPPSTQKAIDAIFTTNVHPLMQLRHAIYPLIETTHVIMPRWLADRYTLKDVVVVPEMLWEVYTIDYVYNRLGAEKTIAWFVDETCAFLSRYPTTIEFVMYCHLSGQFTSLDCALSSSAMTRSMIIFNMSRVCRYLDPIRIWGIFSGYMIRYLGGHYKTSITEMYEYIRTSLVFPSEKGRLTAFMNVPDAYSDVVVEA